MNKFSYIRIVIYFIIFIAFIILSQTNIINLSCVWNDTFGIICPSCGSTRATIAIGNFDIISAMKLNMYYTVVLFPLALFLVINDLYIMIYKSITKKNNISYIEIILGGYNESNR